MASESIFSIHKLNLNLQEIGSRTERLRVLKRRKLKNSLRFLIPRNSFVYKLSLYRFIKIVWIEE